jgi:hypothetical protein
MHVFNDIAVTHFVLGPPVPYGNVKGKTASTGSLCSLAKLPPWTKTVGADLFTNAQANFLDISYTEDSSVGF